MQKITIADMKVGDSVIGTKDGMTIRGFVASEFWIGDGLPGVYLRLVPTRDETQNNYTDVELIGIIDVSRPAEWDWVRPTPSLLETVEALKPGTAFVLNEFELTPRVRTEKGYLVVHTSGGITDFSLNALTGGVPYGFKVLN